MDFCLCTLGGPAVTLQIVPGEPYKPRLPCAPVPPVALSLWLPWTGRPLLSSSFEKCPGSLFQKDRSQMFLLRRKIPVTWFFFFPAKRFSPGSINLWVSHLWDNLGKNFKLCLGNSHPTRACGMPLNPWSDLFSPLKKDPQWRSGVRFGVYWQAVALSLSSYGCFIPPCHLVVLDASSTWPSDSLRRVYSKLSHQRAKLVKLRINRFLAEPLQMNSWHWQDAAQSRLTLDGRTVRWVSPSSHTLEASYILQLFQSCTVMVNTNGCCHTREQVLIELTVYCLLLWVLVEHWLSQL